MRPQITQYLRSLTGGARIGFSAILLLVLNGRIGGISGIVGRLAEGYSRQTKAAVALAGMLVVKRMECPLLAGCFHIPKQTKIDLPLLPGSAILGLGWRLGGLCPGPAVAAKAMVCRAIVPFVVSVPAGMITHDRCVSGQFS